MEIIIKIDTRNEWETKKVFDKFPFRPKKNIIPKWKNKNYNKRIRTY